MSALQHPMLSTLISPTRSYLKLADDSKELQEPAHPETSNIMAATLQRKWDGGLLTMTDDVRRRVHGLFQHPRPRQTRSKRPFLRPRPGIPFNGMFPRHTLRRPHRISPWKHIGAFSIISVQCTASIDNHSLRSLYFCFIVNPHSQCSLD